MRRKHGPRYNLSHQKALFHTFLSLYCLLLIHSSGTFLLLSFGSTLLWMCIQIKDSRALPSLNNTVVHQRQSGQCRLTKKGVMVINTERTHTHTHTHIFQPPPSLCGASCHFLLAAESHSILSFSTCSSASGVRPVGSQSLHVDSAYYEAFPEEQTLCVGQRAVVAWSNPYDITCSWRTDSSKNIKICSFKVANCVSFGFFVLFKKYVHKPSCRGL